MEVMPDHIHLLVDWQTTVLYLGYDQDHEGEHCQADVSCASGTEEGTLGRASVESILLCSDGK